MGLGARVLDGVAVDVGDGVDGALPTGWCPEGSAMSTPGSGAVVEPRLWGEALLRAGERVFLLLDRWLRRGLSSQLNPLQQTGAIAMTAMVVAMVSGVVELFWYSASVHSAYGSVAGMVASPFGAGWVRSVHRYSSDLMMAFMLLHALRLLLERRISGPRWLAWVTGVVSVSISWFVGWTGYWLVWDQRGQHVAEGTAHLLDVLPIFVDPLSRSFLTDSGVNSLLFFVVFFFHMLVPLGLAFVLWLHISRLSRARWITRGTMTAAVLSTLALVAVLLPADIAAPAQMSALGQRFVIDAWYLAPLLLTDRLGGVALWGLFLGVGLFLVAMPWTLVRRRGAAAALLARQTKAGPAFWEPSATPEAEVSLLCTSCELCARDCPYDAIQLVARHDLAASEQRARRPRVDPAKCVSCGICAGACDFFGIGLPAFDAKQVQQRASAWVAQRLAQGQPARVVFGCTDSAAAGLQPHPETGACAELPGWIVVPVPCAGWLGPRSQLAHLLDQGAEQVVVVSCAPGGCRYLEGEEWIRQRLARERKPRLPRGAVERVSLLGLDHSQRSELLKELADKVAHTPGTPSRAWPAPVVATLFAALAASVVVGFTGVRYAAPAIDDAQLVVSFLHPGQVTQHCRQPTAEELAALPVHMRSQQQECDRRRSPVRLQVRIDDVPRWEGSYPPSGLWGDGNSVAVQRIALAPGEHRVSVALADGPDDVWAYQDSQTLDFAQGERRVVLFDRLQGFAWH